MRVCKFFNSETTAIDLKNAMESEIKVSQPLGHRNFLCLPWKRKK